jgi:ankyrin repeat protein
MNMRFRRFIETGSVRLPRGSARFLLSLAFGLLPLLLQGADDLKSKLQLGLFEEEANRNLPAAIAAYQAVLTQFDKDRELAATAVFRLGECYRKLEKTNEAVACYQRIVREFAGATTLARLSQQNLIALSQSSATPGTAKTAGAQQANLIQEQLKLAYQQLAEAAKKVQMGVLPTAGQIPYEREVLRLKRELAVAQGLDGAEQKRLLLQEISLVEKLVETAQRQAQVGVASTEEGINARRDLLALKRELAALEAAPAEGAPLTDDEEKEIRRIQALIQNSPDLISTPGTNGRTPLQDAAAAGYLSVARFLLANKAEVNTPIMYRVPDRKGTATALHMAARNGNKAMVELLLDHGADVNGVGEWQGMTGAALHFAARYGYLAVAETLLAHKADVNLGPEGGSTPLHLAAEAGHKPLVDLLLERGADANAKTDSGWTAMHSAAQGGSLAAAEVLLAHKARADAKTRDGTTPLIVAVRNGQIKVAEFLLKQGAEVAALDADGLTPLQKAVLRRGYSGAAEVVHILLKAGADPNRPYNATGGARNVSRDNAWMDSTGSTPLVVAAFMGDSSMVEALLASGADVNTRSGEGMTPLLYAVQQKSLPMVETILARKPDTEVSDRQGRTALAAAIESRELKIAEKLTKAGAAVNVVLPRFNDFSLLHLAVATGRKDAVELVVTNGARVNVLNSQGQTALELAKEMARDTRRGDRAVYEEIAACLVAHGADENFTRRSKVAVARNSFNARVFTQGTNDWNRYKLLELIATVFAAPTDYPGSSLPFPDFSRVTIQRLGSQGNKPGADKETASRPVTVDLATWITSGDFSQDPWLEWGDIVDLPEQDHPVSEKWGGLAPAVREALVKGLKREVEIIIKGESRKVTLKPSFKDLRNPSPMFPGVPQPSPADARPIELNVFRLNEVVRQSGLLRVSSDLSRVRVSRTDPVTKRPIQWVVDLRPDRPYQSSTDLWLRSGDVIEVPEGE